MEMHMLDWLKQRSRFLTVPHAARSHKSLTQP
jgi:hypothetical protein